MFVVLRIIHTEHPVTINFEYILSRLFNSNISMLINTQCFLADNSVQLKTRRGLIGQIILHRGHHTHWLNMRITPVSRSNAELPLRGFFSLAQLALRVFSEVLPPFAGIARRLFSHFGLTLI